MSQYPKDIERLFTASEYDGDWETTAEKLAEEVARLRQRVAKRDQTLQDTISMYEKQVAELEEEVREQSKWIRTLKDKIAERSERVAELEAHMEGYEVAEFEGGKCPFCSSLNTTRSLEVDRFDYGNGDDVLQVKAEIIVLSCIDCGKQWTGHEAEDSKTEAILKAVATDRKKLRQRVAELEACLRDCAAEAEGYIEAHYENTKEYPSEQRRYARDIACVIKAKQLLVKGEPL